MYEKWSMPLRVMLLVGLAVLLSYRGLFAGSGTYTEGTPDKLTLTAVFEFDVSPDFNPNTDWERTFTKASELLYNSTDGQLQIGTVNFYNNCPEIYDKADVVIRSGSEGASANVSSLDTVGRHVFVSQDVHSLDEPNARGHFGLVHELGHYVFGLYDEYLDAAGNQGASCISVDSEVASIMDGGTTVQPSNRRTEWALAADEAACKDTQQYAKRKMMDWPWIVKSVSDEYGATLVAPTAYNTAMPSGHESVTFHYYECKVRAIVSLDRSGSMDGDKLQTAKEGAGLFIDLTKTEDELGVSSYDDTASVTYPVSSMSDANQAAAKSAIGGIAAGDTTNIGGGLETSLDMITDRGDPVSNEVILLLSDGLHNTGTDPLTVLPAIKARGVSVYTIGLGSDADAALMSSIAKETGGSYYFAASTAGLPAHFNSILAQLRSDGLITALNEAINSGETKDYSVPVDTYTQAGGEVTFVLTWASGVLDFTIVRPDGSVVNEGDSDVTLHIEDALSELIRLSSPAAGNWKATVRSISGTTSYSLQVNSNARSNVSVVTTTDKASYAVNEPILVQTSVSAPATGSLEGQPVVGASVTGNVSLDGVHLSDLTLFDDGVDAHGDAVALDGVYSNYFEPVTAGNYLFSISVNNLNGTTAPPDEKGAEWNPKPVASFTRVSQVTVFADTSTVTQFPDLVVQSVSASDSEIKVEIENQGTAAIPVGQGFWVDLYVDPTTPPTQPNQIWNFLADEGLVWGVDGDVLPMEPGEVITLTLGDALYWPDLSKFSGSLPPGIPVYVQVDSANTNTTYGGVLESHEASGGAYNNVAGPIPVEAATARQTFYLPLLTTEGTAGAAGASEPAGEPEPEIHMLPSRVQLGMEN